MPFQSQFLQTIESRGFIHQGTDNTALDSYLSKDATRSAYIGFDCTAPTLHAGSLLPIMLLRHFQASGHRPIILLGGATTKIGDPSGKDESRTMLNEASIEANKQSIRKVFEKYLSFDGENAAQIIDNSEWLEPLNYINFLREVGQHFSINQMLTMESVKRRVEREQHLSFLEFNYMILQAYDFAYLAKERDCTIQFGGSDQWGNIIQGVELARRMGAANENKEVKLFGLTTPLLETADGQKMGKTAGGAIWLDGERTSPYEFWQYWRNTADGDVISFLNYFSELDIEEIAKLSALEGAEINQAKIILANAVTTLAHGAEVAKQAAQTAEQTFAAGGAGDALPTITISASALENGIAAFELFQQAELAESGGAARRLIRGGGAKLNDAKINEETQAITSSDLIDGQIKLSAGKKRHALVKIS